MNTKLVLFCLTSLLFLQSKSNSVTVSIDVFVNTNQCSTCNIALNALRSLSSDIIKNVHFPEDNKEASEELMEAFGTVKNMRLKYFSKQSNPFKLASQRSYYLVYKGLVRLDSLDLSTLFEHSAQINALVQKGDGNLRLKYKIAIPDSIKLSNRLTVFATNHRLSVCDYILNKNVTFTFKPSKMQLADVIQIKGSAFKSGPFLKSGIVDTAVYRLIYKDIKYVGKTKPEINASYLTDTTLYLFLTFPCGIVRPVEKDTGIGGTFFLYKKNLYTRKSELLAVPEDMLPAYLDEEYYVANIDAFYVKGNKVYYTLYKDNIKKENQFLAEFIRSGNRMMFKSLLNYKVSDSTYLNTNFGNTSVFLTTSNPDFYFANYQPYIIDTKANTVYDFERVLLTKSKHDLIIRDISHAGPNRLRILINFKNQEKCLLYDVQKHQLVAEQNIKPPLPINIETLKFLDSKTLLCFDEANKHLLFFDLE